MSRHEPIVPERFVELFRSSAPYVHAHRGRTFVIVFGGEALLSSGFRDLVHDVALLVALGIRIVLVHGARPQIDALAKQRGAKPSWVGGRRVTDVAMMRDVQAAVGSVRVEIEARLSMGVPSSPMGGARIRVASGNFVVARPIGVVDGVDHGYAVQRLDPRGRGRNGDRARGGQAHRARRGTRHRREGSPAPRAHARRSRSAREEAQVFAPAPAGAKICLSRRIGSSG
jgi:hypothetical protein